MKNFYLFAAAFLILSMLCIPFLSLAAKNADEPHSLGKPSVITEKTVRLKTGDTVADIDVSEYIFGVVAAEIPASYHEEAIKAQAVAAYTYTLYKSAQNAELDYDITSDSALDQAYLPDDKIREKWGDSYTANKEKFERCIKEVSGLYISYNSAPIFAAYHAISSGKTEACADVFGGDYPYLVAVESIGDLLCPDYIAKTEIPISTVREKLSELCSLPNSEAEFIKEITRTPSGGVKTAIVGDKLLEGTQLRSALSLRSANFDLEISGDNFIFTTHGYGHGVGLSQNGANYMAESGSKYDEILLWYYKDCVLIKQ